MYIMENVPLSGYSTMRLGGTAAYLTEVASRNEVVEALQWAAAKGVPAIMIGGGSNIFWSDEGYPGLVMVNKILRFETFQEDEDNLYVTAGAGEVWDSVVERTVQLDYSGIEYMSLIPGSTGGTPVQNVGAYGHEISEVLVSVEAYDTQTQEFVNIPAIDCGFAYRTSRFKTTDKGRFYITAVTLHLMRIKPSPPFYGSLQNYLDQLGIKEYTPAAIRQAVIAIRSSKLPDPNIIANNGSFFANPVVSAETFAQLQADYPEIVHWKLENGQIKLSAGWLLETAGFKGMHDEETGMATWPKQALVLVNENAKSTADLLKFRQKIIDKVQQLFNVTLEQEPELLP
jgi:UDP-N-acetylmuramate dehydrogenase